MPDSRPAGAVHATSSWPLVLCLVGVDYFSTLAYLPSIAVAAAGPWAPLAAGGVVLATFLLALPVYWYVVARAPDGRGAIGLLEQLIPGWRGKLVVLTLLGFAAADFVITRSLSLADAAVHLIQNPHGQRLLADVWDELPIENHALWPPLEYLLRRVADPQVAITLGLSIVSFGAWQALKRGLGRRILLVTAAAVGCYLTLAAIVIGSALVYFARHLELIDDWGRMVFAAPPADGVTAGALGWEWAALGIAVWSFPQMALGLSGFEMILTVVPRIRDGAATADGLSQRVRGARKLMLVAAAVMSLYLFSAVVATTLLVPEAALAPNGAAEHRALAYLAHGSPLADGQGAEVINPLFGERFGDLVDLSTAAILCLAGASVTMGLQSLLPHYLNRLGMEVSWAGKIHVIVHLLNAIVLVVTVVFRASPASQQWAYATSVLVLLSGAALAAAISLARDARPRSVLGVVSIGAAAFFLVMTGLTVVINHSGLTIALAFVAAILISSFISRWIRSTELRFEGFEFDADVSRGRWEALCRSGPTVLVPHRPGLVSLSVRHGVIQREYRLDPATPVVFVEVTLGDPSNFYQQPLMRVEREEELEVIRVSRCCSVAHVLAAMCLELCRDGNAPPEIIFGWSHEPPLAANLNFLLSGEGNIPWMVKALLRKALGNAPRQPRILVG